MIPSAGVRIAPNRTGATFTPDTLLETNGLSVRYNGQLALDNVSFALRNGERMAVVGPNGAGKSTLLKVIAGVQRASAGSVRMSRATDVAYVPQRSLVDWNFPVTVQDVVMMGRAGKIGLLRWPRAADRAIAQRCLATVRMDHLALRQIGELSGGQQQRVFIARALAQEATLVLMDEPLTGLDVTSQEEIFGILDDLRAQDVTVMVSTHDLHQAAEHFDRVMLLNRQMQALGAPNQVLTPEHLTRAYGGQVQLIPTNGGVLVLGDSHCGEC